MIVIRNKSEAILLNKIFKYFIEKKEITPELSIPNQEETILKTVKDLQLDITEITRLSDKIIDYNKCNLIFDEENSLAIKGLFPLFVKIKETEYFLEDNGFLNVFKKQHINFRKEKWEFFNIKVNIVTKIITLLALVLSVSLNIIQYLSSKDKTENRQSKVVKDINTDNLINLKDSFVEKDTIK